MWGFFLMLQAVAKNFGTLAALRALAGAAEACSDPAFMLVTAMWYTRRQQVAAGKKRATETGR